jgi:hypothetical protein
MAENECKSAGCEAACCHDIFFQIPMKKKEILRVFPQVEKISGFKFESEGLPNGVYVSQGYIRIIGPCPNLSDSNCLLKGNNERPLACNKTSRCSDTCIDARRRDSMLLHN